MGILNGGWVSNRCSATTIGVLALIATPVVLVAVACGASVAPPVASEPTASIDITEVVANTRAAMETVTSFRVQGRTEYPAFCAEAIISGVSPARPNGKDVIDTCLEVRKAGLAGIDFFPIPYDREADRAQWEEVYS